MALAFTDEIKLGYSAPGFQLLEPLTGSIRNLHELKGDVATVVMFICNHCPYVKHINEGLVQLANQYISMGISFIAINSNDANRYPDDRPDRMIEVSKEQKYPFPYLYDESQQIAKKYYAVCTPDFSIFNKELKCVYRGQLDNSRPGNNIKVSGNDIRKALNSLIDNKKVDGNQIPSAGCSIKWKV
ncbi:MAG: thioredoxin family protein [Salinivirgaceae bacterium]|jgi:thiol-disulfide isomerase/thioredoxin|nr:thioredoxin family protein [Salinivirgaceae bacterium]